MSCGIAPQLVGDEPPGLASLAFQQFAEEASGSTPIATRLDENVDHVAVLVDSTPEIVSLAPNVHEELIQVPRITQATLSPLEPASIFGTTLPAPLADSLVGDQDSPLGQKIFDITEAQAETVIEPDGVADDLRWESVSVVAGCIVIHPPSLPVAASSDSTLDTVRVGAARFWTETVHSPHPEHAVYIRMGSGSTSRVALQPQGRHPS